VSTARNYLSVLSQRTTTSRAACGFAVGRRSSHNVARFLYGANRFAIEPILRGTSAAAGCCTPDRTPRKSSLVWLPTIGTIVASCCAAVYPRSVPYIATGCAWRAGPAEPRRRGLWPSRQAAFRSVVVARRCVGISRGYSRYTPTVSRRPSRWPSMRSARNMTQNRGRASKGIPV
jgi:hypothetical protein